jgi:hypothetical protein
MQKQPLALLEMEAGLLQPDFGTPRLRLNAQHPLAIQNVNLKGLARRAGQKKQEQGQKDSHLSYGAVRASPPGAA